MVTPQAQIKLNLSVTLKDFLESKARRFGIPMSDYLKHLIIKDVEGEEYPVFEPSEATIQAAKKAMKNIDKSVLLKNEEDIKKFFKNL